MFADFCGCYSGVLQRKIGSVNRFLDYLMIKVSAITIKNSPIFSICGIHFSFDDEKYLTRSDQILNSDSGTSKTYISGRILRFNRSFQFGVEMT